MLTKSDHLCLFYIMLCFLAGSSVCMKQWDPLLPPNLTQNLHLHLHPPPNRKPSPSNLLVARLKAPRIWDLENVGMVHPLRGRWRGSSFPFRHRDVCLWEHDLMDPDSWNKAAIHSRRGRGGVWGEGIYLLRCFLWVVFNITSSHSHLSSNSTEYHCFFLW